MVKKFSKSLFIFRRDLRLEDNIALIKALNESRVVIPCIIIDPGDTSIIKSNNHNALQFFIESVRELNKSLKKRESNLYIFKGNVERVVSDLFWDEDLDAVYINREYSPELVEGEKVIQSICVRKQAEFIQCHDRVLNSPAAVLNYAGMPFMSFADYYEEAIKAPVKKPLQNIHRNYTRKDIPSTSIYELDKMLQSYNSDIFINGGRNNAFNLFEGLAKRKNYDTQKDYPALNATTGLSAHIAFGNVSIREVYRAISESLGTASPLARQLYLHDFHISTGHSSPYSFSGCFNQEFDNLNWIGDIENLMPWKQGKTGFPMVDAGIRQLNQTGFINNRMRMIVASFLVKDLQLNWRLGEKYFSMKLIDYCQSLNNANWQCVASTGCDAHYYKNIIDPFEEQRKYDENCIYVKKWIPELKGLAPSVINNFDKEPPPSESKYPAMMVDHHEESEKSIKMFREIIDQRD